MRFMLLIKSNAKAEAGVPPDAELLSAVAKYNDELERAGVLLTADGLKATSNGARVRIAADKKITVIDGPFAEAKEVVGGFWMIKVHSKAEAIEWAKKAPSSEGEIEVRQVYEVSDFPVDPAEQPDGWRAQEQRFRDADPKAANSVIPPRQPGTKRFMIIHKGNKVSEAGVLPDPKGLEQMGALIQEQIEAGVLLAGEGLQPSSKGARVQVSGAKRTIIDGPFAETKELVAGFSIVQMKTKADAIAFAKRCVVVLPPGMTENELEVRECCEPS